MKLNTEVKNLKLSKKSISLKKGKAYTLKVTQKPIYLTKKAIKWISSNSDVVTVNKDGKIKAIKRGKVKITAYIKDNKKIKAECIIIVE